MPQPTKGSKTTARDADSTLPRVTAALIAERILQEDSGILSAIRIVDRITRSETGPTASPTMQPFRVEGATLLLCLRADKAAGEHVVKIRAVTPSGKRLAAVEKPLVFEPGNEGYNLLTPLGLEVSETGIYWFEISVRAPRARGDRLLTRVPLNVTYETGPGVAS